MASDINIVSFTGNLTGDPQISQTQSGTAYLKFSIAVNEYRKTANNQQQENVHFFPCIIWGKFAETMSRYLCKGSAVALTGQLQQDRWTDQQGNKKSSVSIKVSDLKMTGERRGGNPQNQPHGGQQCGNGYQPQQGYAPPQSARGGPQSNQYGQPDQDIPF